MKFKTQQYTEVVREALLSLSDIKLYETIHSWMDTISEKVWDEEIVDEFRFALGYKLESGETFQSYRNWDEFFCLEPDCEDIYFIAPSPLKLRRYLEEIDSFVFYHQIVFIAGQALGESSIGSPPSVYSDGYEFMQNLAQYLRESLPEQEINYDWESFGMFESELSTESWFKLSKSWRYCEENKVARFPVISSNF